VSRVWIRRFILFHGKRHPSTMSGEEVNRFLSHLASERNGSASTPNQALCVLLFLYGPVLGEKLDWVEAVRCQPFAQHARSRANPFTSGGDGTAEVSRYGTQLVRCPAAQASFCSKTNGGNVVQNTSHLDGPPNPALSPPSGAFRFWHIAE